MWDDLVIAYNTELLVVGRGEWVGVEYPWSGIKYNPFLWSLVLGSIAMPSLVSWTFSLLRVALNPALQNWPRDRRGCCSAGKTSKFW